MPIISYFLNSLIWGLWKSMKSTFISVCCKIGKTRMTYNMSSTCVHCLVTYMGHDDLVCLDFLWKTESIDPIVGSSIAFRLSSSWKSPHNTFNEWHHHLPLSCWLYMYIWPVIFSAIGKTLCKIEPIKLCFYKCYSLLWRYQFCWYCLCSLAKGVL